MQMELIVYKGEDDLWMWQVVLMKTRILCKPVTGLKERQGAMDCVKSVGSFLHSRMMGVG